MLSTIQLLLLMVAASLGGRSPRCGGIYTAARGILQTPEFPYNLPVPINCEWVIDAQNLATENTSIVVYFTQLFLYEGLTFTEYQIYDKTYQVDGRVVYSVNETNIVQVRWVQSFQNFLVISLKLDSVDSAHLRVLDAFLDVYGFNITYEITTNGVRTDSCTMMDCGFTGTCYDHYTAFSCDCFNGYKGARCSSGPKSLCNIGGSPTCKNGGTCVHVGMTAVKCRCPPGFSGETCQITVNTQNVCESCVTFCSYDGNIQNACNCSNKSYNSSHERIRYSCTMHLANLPNLNGEALKNFIHNQIQQALRINYSKIEDLNVENIQYFRTGADVTFYLFAMRKDEKRIRSILNRWSDRGYISNLTIVDKQFIFGPSPDLQRISINHYGIIRQHDEFILSCVARGSTTMTFRWFKDGIFINVTETTSHKWTRLIKDPHQPDQYTALLGVEKAIALDSGIFTCQVEDFGLQQCLSRRVIVKGAPIIKVEPMNQTVRKGGNFTLNCITIGTPINKFTYSWTKNNELIPVCTENEKYEVLYPGGSILQVFNIEKSVKYSCLVQDEATSAEIAININVIDRDLVKTCPFQAYLETEWTETAPDTDALQFCPKGYVFPGYIKRTCTLKDGINPVWLLPDYSHCTSKGFDEISKDMLQLGYETTTTIQTLRNCLKYLENGSNSGVYPGEGARILYLLRDVIFSGRRQLISDSYNVTIVVFDIIDKILTHPDSLIGQEQVELLQQIIKQQVEIASLSKHQFVNISKPTIQFNLLIPEQNPILQFDNFTKTIRWQLHIVNINQLKLQKIGIVIYRNLIDFLPTRSVLRLKDGNEIEYEIISQVVYVWLKQQNGNHTNIMFKWKSHNTNWQKDKWHIRCANVKPAIFAYSWNTTICSTQIINNSFIKCTCPEAGLFALLLTNHVQLMSKHVDKEQTHPKRYAVLAGCSLCFLAAFFCSIILFLHWILKSSCIGFLKFQCTVSLAFVMILLMLTTISEPSESMFMNVMSLIEIFLLMSLSAHISTLLIVYTELVQLPKSTTSKQTITGISIGVPVITVFGNHLAHRTMDIQLKSWWLLAGTLSFHIFLTVLAVLSVLFSFLCIIIYGKFKKLTVVHEKEGKALKTRISLLKKSACVFSSSLLLTVSSILYINFFDIIWWQYEFCTVAIIQGVVIIVCYIIKSESKFYLLHGKLKLKSEDDFFGIETTGSPLNFFTKEDGEIESKNIPHRKSALQQTVAKSVECYQISDIHSGLPECVSNTMETFLNRDAVGGRLHNDSIENYNHSPQLYRKNSTFKCDDKQKQQLTTASSSARCRSPDIIATKNCTELDLIASHAPSIIITPEESTNELVTSPSDEWVPKRVQPEGREIATVCDKVVELEPSVIVLPTTNDESNLDRMLDRISHDLDYLLNRSDDMPEITDNDDEQTNSLRQLSKTPLPGVIPELEEEDEQELGSTKTQEVIMNNL